MSAESASGSDGFGLMRAIGKLRIGAERPLMDHALAAKGTARQQAPSHQSDCDPAQARPQEPARTGCQEGLDVWPLPGLGPMTRVRTSFGDLPAAALRKGDEVLTEGGAYRRIVWLNRVHLDEHILATKDDSNPVVIAPRALEGLFPAAEIMVSPRHIIVADAANGLKSDCEAAMLVGRPGIRRLRETSMSYTMFHVGETAAVCVEGLYLKFPLDD